MIILLTMQNFAQGIWIINKETAIYDQIQNIAPMGL